MPTDDNSMRMNTDRSSEILSDIINRLDRSLGSINSTMKDIGKVVKDVQSNMQPTTKSGKSNQIDQKTVFDTLRELKQLRKDISDFSDGFESSIEEQKKTIKGFQTATKENESEFSKYLREQQKIIAESRLKETQKINKEYKDRIQTTDLLYADKENKLNRRLELYAKILSNPASSNEKKSKAQEQYDRIQKEVDALIASKRHDQETAKADAEEQRRNLERSVRQKEERVSQQSDLEDLIGNMNSRLAQMSPYFSKLQPEKSDADQKREFFDEQLNILEKAKKEIDDAIRENSDLNDKERENLERQRKAIDEQQKMIKQWNPAKEALTKAGKSLLEAGKSIFKTFAGSVFGTLEDKYLMSYKEGFSNVYNSVEQTRNTVSARLKMDQGDFTNLQDRIQDRIYEAGMESVISEVDVNDAIVALSGAGVTNEKVLEELALQQAELKATGSSLDLANEETLNMIRQFLNQQQNVEGKSLEDSLDSLHNILQAQAGAQTMQQENGWDSALIAGGANTQFNQTLNRALLGQKSEKEIMDDIVASYSYADYLNSLGLDENILQQYLKDITDSSVADLNTFEQILVDNSGLSREAILDMPAQEAYDKILTTLEKILSQTADGDTQFIADINKAFGTGLTSEDLIRLMHNTMERPIVSTQEALDAQSKNLQEANTYYSATKTHQKETENELGKIANEAEQYYKGNNYVEAGFNAVETGINSLIDIGTELVFGIAKGYGSNILGSGVGSSVGSSVGAGGAAGGSSGVLSSVIGSSFVGGASGLVAAGGVAAAGAIAAALAYQFIGKPWRESIENAVDPIQEATEEFMDSMNKQQNEAHKETLEEEETLNMYKRILESNNKTAMTNYLSQDANLREELKNIQDDRELQELFKKNILDEQENIVNQKKINEKLADVLNEDSQFLADAKSGWQGRTYANYGKNWEEMTDEEKTDFVEKHQAEFAGKLTSKGIHDIGEQLESATSLEGSDMDAYLVQNGVSTEAIKNMTPEEKKEKAKEVKLKQIEKQAGYEGEVAGLLENEMNRYYDRKKIYEEASETFSNRLDLAKNQWMSDNPGKEPSQYDIMDAYISMYYPKSHKLPEDSDIAVDENGNYYLDPGDTYQYRYSFKTGLTNVPYNNYPALLHEGERVLTAEEAEAYNEMSSYAVSNMVNQNKTYGNSSNNVFNTNTYGPTDFERSINNQTNSLNSTLNQILGVLRSIMNSSSYSGQTAGFRNAIKGNSNLGQLNTV